MTNTAHHPATMIRNSLAELTPLLDTLAAVAMRGEVRSRVHSWSGGSAGTARSSSSPNKGLTPRAYQFASRLKTSMTWRPRHAG
jgi:hypothetical protein